MATRLPSGSPRLLRRLNSAAVLDAIRRGGPVSRTELAGMTGLSKPTVNDLVQVLLDGGYVTESSPDGVGRPRRPGRRARLLRFRSDLGYVLGIDIGANKTLALVSDLDGQPLAIERRRTTAAERADAGALLRKVRSVAGAALSRAGVAPELLHAVGVGTPGVVDPVSGSVTLATVDALEGVRLGPRLARSFACPVLVDNEVHLSLLAERWRGAAEGIDNAFYVQIGVGIGGGILIGGDVYRGAAGAAGEVGFLPLFDVEAPSDRLGPFEHAAGGSAFARLGRRAAERHPGSALARVAGGRDAIDAEAVFAAAAAGDAAAGEVLDELVERLARGIAAAVVVLNPATVIVGGGISRAGEQLLGRLERRITELVPVPSRIALSTLGDEAVALGAVRLALQAVEERLFAVTAVAPA